MKLILTLPERPGFLHAVPILNIFALMQLFFLLGPSLLLQSGVSVDLPPSKFQMERFEDSLVVTLGPGESSPRIHLGRDPISAIELSSRLDQLRADGVTSKAIVLMQTDAGTPVGTEREIAELILSKGFRLAMVGKSAPRPASANPKAD